MTKEEEQKIREAITALLLRVEETEQKLNDMQMRINYMWVSNYWPIKDADDNYIE